MAIIITISSKNHKLILKVGQMLDKQDIYIVSKYIPPGYLLITKEKSSNSTVEEPDFTVIDIMPPNVIPREAQITSGIVLSREIIRQIPTEGYSTK